MLSFDRFLMTEGSPIYLQIIRYIQRGIVAGSIRPEEELPSRRMLSARLGVNPNTIQKAYRILEEEGVIQSHAGAKSLVAADEGTVARIRVQLLEGDADTLVRAMKQMGVSRQEALEVVDRLWDRPESADSAAKEEEPE